MSDFAGLTFSTDPASAGVQDLSLETLGPAHLRGSAWSAAGVQVPHPRREGGRAATMRRASPATANRCGAILRVMKAQQRAERALIRKLARQA